MILSFNRVDFFPFSFPFLLLLLLPPQIWKVEGRTGRCDLKFEINILFFFFFNSPPCRVNRAHESSISLKQIFPIFQFPISNSNHSKISKISKCNFDPLLPSNRIYPLPPPPSKLVSKIRTIVPPSTIARLHEGVGWDPRSRAQVVCPQVRGNGSIGVFPC